MTVSQQRHLLAIIGIVALALSQSSATVADLIAPQPPAARPQPNPIIPARGIASAVPASRWDYGFLTGNGRTAATFFGQPPSETILVNHEKLFLPKAERPGILPDLGEYLPEVRRIIREKDAARPSYWATDEFMKAGARQNRLTPDLKSVAAEEFLRAKSAEKGKNDPPRASYHPGFELKIETTDAGPVTNYFRTTDFQTGEVAVRWENSRGTHARRLFVSRPDNVTVLSITGTGAGGVSCTLYVPNVAEREPRMVCRLIKSDIRADRDWIVLRTEYVFDKGGYDSAIRVVPRGGTVESDGKKIVVSGADEVLVLMKIEPFAKLTPRSAEGLKAAIREDENQAAVIEGFEHGIFGEFVSGHQEDLSE
ncbi:MAG: glycoside hydrolase family 95 protein [Verrucomicrobia bacterium]|nr:glycoside hydrolase family 95 protein [Verrucomicrobiota bacterium]